MTQTVNRFPRINNQVFIDGSPFEHETNGAKARSKDKALLNKQSADRLGIKNMQALTDERIAKILADQ